MTRGKASEGHNRISNVGVVYQCPESYCFRRAPRSTAHLEQVDSHIELTTITDWIAVDVPNETTVHWLVDEVYHVLQVVVASSSRAKHRLAPSDHVMEMKKVKPLTPAYRRRRGTIGIAGNPPGSTWR